jgi:hypothetical protein
MSDAKKSYTIWIILGGAGLLLGLCCLVVVLAGVYFYPTMLTGLPAVAPTIQGGVALTPDLMLTAYAIAGATPNVPLTESPVTQAPLPQTTEPPVPPTAEPPPTIDYMGIQFSFGPPVAQSAQPETIPAAPGDPAQAFPGEIHPEYYQFKFSGYPLSGTFHEPQILIYPAPAYAAMDPGAAQIIQDLKTLLAQKPSNPERIPFLPLWNAGQMMQSNVKYLEFKNGSGVRFLSQYGQAYYPVNNKDMFYTFQGLTSDEQWYVAAVMPASHSSLPSDQNQIPGGNFESFANNFETYMAGVEQTLSALTDNSFVPDLSQLDGLFQSMRVK